MRKLDRRIAATLAFYVIIHNSLCVRYYSDKQKIHSYKTKVKGQFMYGVIKRYKYLGIWANLGLLKSFMGPLRSIMAFGDQ